MIFKKSSIAIVFFLVVVTILLSIGLLWGRVESWHPDDRARYSSVAPFSVIDWRLNNYLKPPLYTYIIYFFVKAPLFYSNYFLRLDAKTFAETQLLLILSLNVVFFLSSIFFVYKTLQLCIKSKELIFLGTFLYGTSAGLHVFVRYTTVDTFLIFWTTLIMWLSLLFYVKQKNIFLYAASFCIGLATATKYNGIILVIIPLLLIDLPKKMFRRYPTAEVLELLKKGFFISIFTFLGVIIGIPVLFSDGKKVVLDFIFNLEVSPLYHGGYSYSGYVSFFSSLATLIGWPTLIACSAGFILLAFRKHSLLFVTLVCFLAINYLYFGSYTSPPARFLVHIIPAIFITGFVGIDLAYSLFQKYRMFLRVILCIVLFYNLICSLLVGLRFKDNPRMNFQEWSKTNIPEKSTIIKSKFIPSLALYSGVNIVERLMKIEEVSFLNEQLELSQNDSIRKEDILYKIQESQLWLERLEQLDGSVIPGDFIVFDSDWGYFEIPNLYPLLVTQGFSGCTRVFDEIPQTAHVWSYPHALDFVETRVTAFHCQK